MILTSDDRLDSVAWLAPDAHRTHMNR